VFVHVRSFSNRRRRPVGKEVVTYELHRDERGRPRAEKVAFAGDRVPPARRHGRVTVPQVFAGVFACLVAGGVVAGKLPWILLAWYLAVCVVTFFAYALDKSAARDGKWRTQESSLHLLSLAGGWPGALLAQQWLRHKSKKQSFQSVFWVTVLLNCAALGWLVSPHGAAILELVATWV